MRCTTQFLRSIKDIQGRRHTLSPSGRSLGNGSLAKMSFRESDQVRVDSIPIVDCHSLNIMLYYIYIDSGSDWLVDDLRLQKEGNPK